MFKLWILSIFVFFASCGYCSNTDLPKGIIISDSLRFKAKSVFLPQKDSLYLQLTAPTENKDKDRKDTLKLELMAAVSSDVEEIKLLESGKDSGVFQSVQGIAIKPGNKMAGDSILQVFPAKDTITVFYPDSGKKTAIASVDSASAVDRLAIDLEDIQIAGKPFRIKISLQDKEDKALESYTGSVNLEVVPVLPKESKSKIVPDKISSFRWGRAGILAVYPESGEIKIVARDLNNNITGESKVITFLPAKFKIETPASQTVGKEFAVKITVLNYNDQVALNYSGSAFIELEDSPTPFFKKTCAFLRAQQ